MIFRRMIVVLFLFSGMFVMVTVACRFNPLNRQSAPTHTNPPLPVSTADMENFEGTVTESVEQFQASEQIYIEINETEFTTYITNALESQENPVLRDPKIYFRDGQVTLIGQIEQSGFLATLEVIITLSVDPNGLPQYEIMSAKIGPLAIPESMLNEFYRYMDSAFESNIRPRTNDIYIESIEVGHGKIVIIGHKR